LLFKKLREKQVLDEEEIEFLEQLYSRYYIRAGDQMFRANCGVAQGSVISPALFNIFIEDLAYELREKAQVDLEDIMMYADDILTLCTTPGQLKTAIKVIEEWCEKNGMTLNKSKSGIITFAARNAKQIPNMQMKKTTIERPRKNKTKKGDANPIIKEEHREWIPAKKDVCGIPVCTQYKYLGTIITPKLSIDPQIKFITRKAAHLQVKLAPYLNSATADGRKDMFQTFVMPLFNAAYILMRYEPSESNKTKLINLHRGIFKRFTRLTKGTSSELVAEMIGNNLNETATYESIKNQRKWEDRKEGIDVTRMKMEKTPNTLRGVPKSWIDLVNSQFKPCPLCKKKGQLTSRWHLKYKHNIILRNVLNIWKNDIIPVSTKKNLTRIEIHQELKPIITKHLKDYEQMVGAIST
jgi:uncharacterized protein (DUF2249 family)